MYKAVGTCFHEPRRVRVPESPRAFAFHDQCPVPYKGVVMVRPSTEADDRRPLAGTFAFIRMAGNYLTSSFYPLPVMRFHENAFTWGWLSDRR